MDFLRGESGPSILLAWHLVPASAVPEEARDLAQEKAENPLREETGGVTDVWKFQNFQKWPQTSSNLKGRQELNELDQENN